MGGVPPESYRMTLDYLGIYRTAPFAPQARNFLNRTRRRRGNMRFQAVLKGAQNFATELMFETLGVSNMGFLSEKKISEKKNHNRYRCKIMRGVQKWHLFCYLKIKIGRNLGFNIYFPLISESNVDIFLLEPWVVITKT